MISLDIVDVWSGFRCFRETNNLLLNAVPVIFCDSVPITSSIPNLPSLETQIRLYPNPTAGQVQLELPSDALPVLLTLNDALGRRLKTVELTSPVSMVELGKIESPWLMVQLRSHDGRVAGKMLVLSE